MDFQLVIDAFLTGTPVAILVALVGIVWQAIYTHSRDKAHDEQVKRELKLEDQKFNHQQEIEKLKFGYEQLRWREELAREIALKHVEVRLEEYTKAWSYIEEIARNQLDTGKLTPETTKEIAQQIKNWRYSKGGLIAEEITRDAAFALQRALWEYDGSKVAYSRVRRARKIFRDALRADTGIGEVAGQSIIILTEGRQKIREELIKLQTTLGIEAE